jgi:hypothetical protein
MAVVNKGKSQSRLQCYWCGSDFHYSDRPRPQYIYPVPSDQPGKVDDNRAGFYACGKCAPEVLVLQIEMGLVEDWRKE